MNITSMKFILNAADLDAESLFWARLLQGTVVAEDDWHSIIVDGHEVLAVQLAPDHVPPRWPHGEPPMHIHPDLWVADIHAAEEEVLAAGATLIQETYPLTASTGFRVYVDPAGHPFCLCWK